MPGATLPAALLFLAACPGAWQLLRLLYSTGSPAIREPQPPRNAPCCRRFLSCPKAAAASRYNRHIAGDRQESQRAPATVAAAGASGGDGGAPAARPHPHPSAAMDLSEMDRSLLRLYMAGCFHYWDQLPGEQAGHTDVQGGEPARPPSDLHNGCAWRAAAVARLQSASLAWR